MVEALPNERLQRILELLEAREMIRVPELAAHFAVSEVTVRGDLAELARQGLVTRVRGGARALDRGEELAFDIRLRLQSPEKHAIARAAAALVDDGDAIAVDCSTSSYYLALQLRDRHELVVVTNGLFAAEALTAAPGVNVLLAGGMLRRASMSTVGDLGVGLLETAHINKGFFGARGLTSEHGLMDLNPDEVKVKRALAGACEHVYGVVDRTKWTRRALLAFVPPEHVTGIVTDTGAPEEAVAEWATRGVEVIQAEPLPAGEQPRRVPVRGVGR